ncbi:acyltransferase family protein [Paucibacter sp. Y2R2-4]|uniref:acyltransferase family protein n=1 Tax=Paucibacter sp. Y2R2-4 TaxID=2893553 RepID=UPI0021E3AB94|nr:acyltransferase [Paucibacter sp. Y2R2-4]MCV2349264.1 acyltransferase [Paucibacter sp. Y2R2-4]
MRIVSLDGCRGLAAIVVVVFHLPWLFGLGVPHGYLAVDFFFILSGWVLALAYEQKILGGLSFKKFIVVRLARLYPLYLIALLLGALALLLKQAAGEKQPALTCVFQNMALAPCWAMKEAFPINSPSWSIFSEIFVNIVWFFVVSFGLTRFRHKLAVNFCLIVLMWVFVGSIGRYLYGFQSETIYEGFIRAMAGFSSGVVLYSARGDRRLVWYFSFMALLILAGLSWLGNLVQSAILIDVFFVVFLFPTLLWLMAGMELQSRFFEWLGDISFSVYLLHVPLSVWSQPILKRLIALGDFGQLTAVLLYLVVLFGVSALFFSKFELPARSYFLARFSGAKI